jgi:hypothetical protein
VLVMTGGPGVGKMTMAILFVSMPLLATSRLSKKSVAFGTEPSVVAFAELEMTDGTEDDKFDKCSLVVQA